ncbi:hypothetical protein [Novosphingobium sp.]|uniref:hypothetical protein n=1 Tax=Novosphingobium sp. TaxID=1874826 RepID=UPI0035B33134
MRLTPLALFGAIALASAVPVHAITEEPAATFDLANTAPAERGKLVELPQGAGWIHYDPDGWYNMIVLEKGGMQVSPPPDAGFKYTYRKDGSYTMVVVTKKPAKATAQASAQDLEAMAMAMNASGSAFAPNDLPVTSHKVIEMGKTDASKRPVLMATWEGAITEDGQTTYYVMGIVPTRKGLLYAHCFSDKSADFCRLILTQGLRMERGAYQAPGS